ncbi:MAG: M23 family metallopeptidase [Patescibacteria group bacterium]
MKNFFWLLTIILALGLPLVSFASAKNNIIKTFYSLRSESVWPVKDTTSDNIISPFGVRWLGRYDWHYGLDIGADRDTEVLAPQAGTVYKIWDYSESGRTIILEHDFEDGVRFKNQDIKHYYTWYLHLNGFVSGLAEGQSISKGEIIGYVGTSGGAGTPHLHFELRVGTPWSLEDQSYYPNSPTSTGFDPAVNPLFLFKPKKSRTALSLLSVSEAGEGNLGVLYAQSNYQTAFNKVSLIIRKKKNNKKVFSYILNLNQRTGFNANSISQLDTPDASRMYLDPSIYCLSGGLYSINIIIPQSFVSKYSSEKYQAYIVTQGLWGRTKKIKLF